MKSLLFGWLALCGMLATADSALGAQLASGSTQLAGGPIGGPTPLNVVIFFTDDQGYGDLSSFGHPTILTPNIDRLAREGAKLTQFYVASPVCSPSRAALLTGCYPKRVGMQKHVIFPDYDYGLNSAEVTLADLLKSRGYATGMFGKWHLGHRPGLLPLDQGFDRYAGVPYSNDMSQFHRKPGSKYKLHLPWIEDAAVSEWEPDQTQFTKRCTEAALEFIDQQHQHPFFLYMPYSMPHIPIYASDEFLGISARGLYGDVIEEIDHSVGQVLAKLEEHGLKQNTLVIFTSDNGPWLTYKERGGSAGPLRGGKGTNWEGGQRVPCVMRWPGVIPAGSVRTEVLTAMDIFPTVAAMTAGISTKNGGARGPDKQELFKDDPYLNDDPYLKDFPPIDGQNILPILRGLPNPEFDPALRPFLYYTSQGELAGIRRGAWKLLLENTELYNLETDISERFSRAEKHPQRVEELRALAIQLDAEIETHARPVQHVATMLFDPKKIAGTR
jgi:arylsulfatase A